MYERLLNTSLICQFETGTKEEKQRAKEILKVIKKCIIKNEVSKQPENSSKKLVKNLKSKKILNSYLIYLYIKKWISTHLLCLKIKSNSKFGFSFVKE